MSIGLEHYLILTTILFAIGLYGALTKRNAVVILMCIELMLNAVNIAMVAFSRFIVPLMLTGQVFAIFIMVRKVNQLKKKEEAAPPPPTKKSCPHCLSEIPIKAVRCAFCTSEIKDA